MPNFKLALAALSLSAAVAPQPAIAAGAQNTVEFVWTIHLGGLSLGTIGFKGQFQGDTYSAVSKLKTSGVVNSFYAATIDATATGFMKDGKVSPATYDSMYEGEKSKQRVALNYSAAGVALTAEPAYDVKRFPIPDDQKKDTVDPMSGIVQAVSGVSTSANNPCGNTVRVFDGRRRYDIELTFVEQTELTSSTGGYTGKATLCNGEYKQVAGFKPNLNKGKDLPPIQIWLAKFPAKAGGPVKEFAVPVKIQSETPFGVAVTNARNIVVEGQKIGG